jgi:hypothetical protein
MSKPDHWRNVVGRQRTAMRLAKPPSVLTAAPSNGVGPVKDIATRVAGTTKHKAHETPRVTDLTVCKII